VTAAWLPASSHAQAAELAARDPQPDMSIRADGVLVGSAQQVRLHVEGPDPAALARFWRTALNYEDAGDGTIVDRLRRCPPVRFGQSDDHRPLRNRIHLDSGHPGPTADTVTALKAAGGRERFVSEWYTTLADADGNEVDVIPGAALGDESTSDWTAMFGGMVHYPTTPRPALEFAAIAARLADEAGIPLMIDLRPAGVVLDSGKDQWEEVAGFAELAAAVQAEARAAGLSADNSGLRFVQVGIDAVDVPAVREFWRVALGYVPAPNPDVTDLFDPRQLDPVVFIQPMDPTETDRRRQRNRTRVELLLPPEELPARTAAALAAGGRQLAENHLTDPEGNELVLRRSGR
jgi:Glyoxalase-like domain